MGEQGRRLERGRREPVQQRRRFRSCNTKFRYWTVSGAFRNVPVGAGRRKNLPLGAVVAAGAGPVRPCHNQQRVGRFQHRGGCETATP